MVLSNYHIYTIARFQKNIDISLYMSRKALFACQNQNSTKQCMHKIDNYPEYTLVSACLFYDSSLFCSGSNNKYNHSIRNHYQIKQHAG